MATATKTQTDAIQDATAQAQEITERSSRPPRRPPAST